jgi:hypothetical protein
METNINIETRSKLWNEFLKSDKNLATLMSEDEKALKQAQRAQVCGDSEGWQKLLNEHRQLNTKIVVMNMQKQRAFIDIVQSIEIHNSNPLFN